MNKKSLYRPPKVKPSKRAKKPLPEWNSFQTDLDRYKLSSTEILKKKINAVSKNKEIAKKDLLETLSQMQTGKYITDDADKKPKKKIDLVPRHRFQKEERGIFPKSRPKSASGKHMNLKNKTNEEDEGEEEDEDELKMIQDDTEATVTKVEKNCIMSENKKGGLKSNGKNNPLLFQEFEETLKQMEKEIQNNNDIIDNQLINQQKQMILNSKLPTQADKRMNTEMIKQNNTGNINKNKPKNKREKNAHRSDNEEEEDEVADENQRDKLKTKNDNNNNDDDAEEEDKDDVYEIQKDIDKKFDKLNDIEDCMKRLDCMLDNSKQKSMKMKYDLDFNEGEGYRSEEEQKAQEIKQQPKNNPSQPPIKQQKCKEDNRPLPQPIKQKNNRLSLDKPTDNYMIEDDDFGYRSEIIDSKEEHIHYDNNLRDSELYLTNAKLQDQLIQKEKQIRQNLQTSPNKTNEDNNDDYFQEEEIEDNNNQDAVNQARLLSIKNELLKSNKMTQKGSQFIQDDRYGYESEQQRSFPIQNQVSNNIPSYPQSFNGEYTKDYNHLPIPTKNHYAYSIEPNAYYKNDTQMRTNPYTQQPPIKKPTDYSSYQKKEPNKQNTQIKQQANNKPLYSLSNYNEDESKYNISKPLPQDLNHRTYKDDLEEEQPHQIKPNRLNEVSSNYTTGSQGKSIKIERNIIDITKHKAKIQPNEMNIFDGQGNASREPSNNIQQMNQIAQNTPNDPMNYFKNLLEKTKEEIDQLTQGLDDVQPSISSYPQGKYNSTNVTQMPLINKNSQMPYKGYYNN